MDIVFLGFCFFTIIILISFGINEKHYQEKRKKSKEEILNKPSINYKEEALRQDKWTRELFYK